MTKIRFNIVKNMNLNRMDKCTKLNIYWRTGDHRSTVSLCEKRGERWRSNDDDPKGKIIIDVMDILFNNGYIHCGKMLRTSTHQSDDFRIMSDR